MVLMDASGNRAADRRPSAPEVEQKDSKHCFFEKKQQKTFC
jgi:hypothetical protein